MQLRDDVQLLTDWRKHADRDAMDQLVRRHINFVYSTARRQVQDAHLAEDVTQAVFMLLMSKSPALHSEGALAVWLHNTTRYASSNARRMRSRREYRERQASRMSAVERVGRAPVEDGYSEIMPMLDEAIGWLPRRDREGVILCFFERCSYRQIGAVLGLTEDAARKRVGRAVERMREYFASRGLSATSAAVTSCLIAESTIAAPPALLAATMNFAAATQLAGATALSTAIFNGVIHTMILTKIKFAAAACAAIILGGAVTGAAIHQATAPMAMQVVASTALATGAYDVKASDQIEVKFLGVARWGADGNEWTAIDGAKIDDPRGPFANEQLRTRPETTHQAMLHVSGPQLNGGYSVKVPQATFANLWDLTPSADEAYLLVPFGVPANQKTVDVELLLADGDWKTIVNVEHEPGRPLGSHQTDLGGIVFTHVIDAPGGGCMVYVAHDLTSPQFEVFATDPQGNEHRANNISGGPVGKFTALRYDFNITSEEITALSVKVRPFSKRVTAKNVTLDPSQPSKPQIEVTDVPQKN